MEHDYPYAFLGEPFRWIALVLLFALAAAAVTTALFLAGLPGRIASRRGHPQASAVSVCGWLGLPTGVLWALALAWAYYRPSATGDGPHGVGLDQKLSRVEGLVSQLETPRQTAQ